MKESTKKPSHNSASSRSYSKNDVSTKNRYDGINIDAEVYGKCAIDLDDNDKFDGIDMYMHDSTIEDLFILIKYFGLLSKPRKTDTETTTKDICKKLIIKKEKQKAKNKAVLQRRQQFKNKRPQLILAMLDSGIEYVCNHESCEVRSNLQIDHIYPLSRGGSDDLDNLQFLCAFHNGSKGDKTEY